MNSEATPCQSAPPSIPYDNQKQESITNAIDSDNADYTPEAKINCVDLPLVLPFTSGMGLPYAPINWPCQGDDWSWRVGRRIFQNGYFADRFLFPPTRLQKSKRRNYFAGIKTLATYIQTEFPGADVNAFLASFSWKVPANNIDLSIEFTGPWPLNIYYGKRIEKNNEAKEWEHEEHGQKDEVTRTNIHHNGAQEFIANERRHEGRKNIKIPTGNDGCNSQAEKESLFQDTYLSNVHIKPKESVENLARASFPNWPKRKKNDDKEKATNRKQIQQSSTRKRITRQSFKRYFSSSTKKHEAIVIDLTQDTKMGNSSSSSSKDSPSLVIENEKLAHIEAQIYTIDDQIALLQSRRAEIDNDLRVKVKAKNKLVDQHKRMKDAISSIEEKEEMGKFENQELESKNVDAAK